MSKQMIGWSCALMMFAVLVASGQLVAQQRDADPFGDQPVQQQSRQIEPKSELGFEAAGHSSVEKISMVLGSPLKTPLNYDSEQLDIVLETIADEYGIPIVFDKAALDEVAISPESEVTVNLRGISLRSAFELIFREPGLEDLTFTIDREVLLITTEERANETLVTKVYRVDEFQSSHQSLSIGIMYGASAWADFNPFIDMITSCIEPKSWKENGTGDGNIRAVNPGMLVIAQTRHVHEQIENLLAQLHTTRRQILNDATASVSRTSPITRGFNLNLAFDDLKTGQLQERITTAIKRSVDWSEENLAEEDAWIEVLPGRVLVRHTPDVLTQVAVALVNMKLIAPTTMIGGGGGFHKGGGGGGAF